MSPKYNDELKLYRSNRFFSAEEWQARMFKQNMNQTSISTDMVIQQPKMPPAVVSVSILNCLRIKGMPPHKLDINIGTTYTITSNVNVELGLYRGAVIRVISYNQDELHAVRMNSSITGRSAIVRIPKVCFYSNTERCAYAFGRLQFPISPTAVPHAALQMGSWPTTKLFRHISLFDCITRNGVRYKLLGELTPRQNQRCKFTFCLPVIDCAQSYHDSTRWPIYTGKKSTGRCSNMNNPAPVASGVGGQAISACSNSLHLHTATAKANTNAVNDPSTANIDASKYLYKYMHKSIYFNKKSLPNNYGQRYQGALAMVTRNGNSGAFITISAIVVFQKRGPCQIALAAFPY